MSARTPARSAPTLSSRSTVTEPVAATASRRCRPSIRGRRRTPLRGLLGPCMSRWTPVHLAGNHACWPSPRSALLRAGGQLDFLERAAVDARAAVLAHDVESDLVIVGIDARSLQALNEWPWPRRHHARLLQQLKRAQPDQVFLDIDFSSTSPDAEDDSLFERALAEWQGAPVVLAAHFQPASGANDNERIVTRPLQRSLSTLGSPRSCSCRAPTAWSGKCGALGNSRAKRCPPSSRSMARSPRIPPSGSISRLAGPPSVTCRS